MFIVLSIHKYSLLASCKAFFLQRVSSSGLILTTVFYVTNDVIYVCN